MSVHRPSQYDIIIRAMRICNENYGHPCSRRIWWKVAPETIDTSERVSLFVDCTDVFVLGARDTVEITPENIHILEESYADMAAIDKNWCEMAHVLFCCRVRKILPRASCLVRIDPKFYPLFRACEAEKGEE